MNIFIDLIRTESKIEMTGINNREIDKKIKSRTCTYVKNQKVNINKSEVASLMVSIESLMIKCVFGAKD